MTRPHFAGGFKIDASKRINERGYFVAEVSKRLGVSTHSLYAWQNYPLCKRAEEDAGQTDLIKESWKDSGKKYGYLKPTAKVLIHSDQKFTIHQPGMGVISKISRSGIQDEPPQQLS